MLAWTKHLPFLLVLAASTVGTPWVASAADPLEGPKHPSLPAGWFLTESAPQLYETMLDTSTPCEGTRSALLQSRSGSATGYGTLMQAFSAEDFRGKRLRFSAALRTRDVKGWAGLWMRVEGPSSRQPLAFDNMQSRALSGTHGCQRYEVVLEVTPEATSIMAGLLLSGSGQAWVDGVRFEVVGASVPVTDLLASPALPVLHEGPLPLEGGPARAARPQTVAGSVGHVWFNEERVDFGTPFLRQADGTWKSILSEVLTEQGGVVQGTFEQRPVHLKVTLANSQTVIQGTWGTEPVLIRLGAERLVMRWGRYNRELVRDAERLPDPECIRFQSVSGPRILDRVDVCRAALHRPPPMVQLVTALLANGFRADTPPNALPVPEPPTRPARSDPPPLRPQ